MSHIQNYFNKMIYYDILHCTCLSMEYIQFANLISYIFLVLVSILVGTIEATSATFREFPGFFATWTSFLAGQCN